MSIELARFDAFAFDLDGVVTNTAAVHAAAWKRAFDELLEGLANGKPWQPFDLDREYRAHVDGKPRRDGIRSLLESRGISLSEGKPGDGPEAPTIHGLAERKNRYLREQLRSTRVEVHEDAVVLLHEARSCRVRVAVVSSSENCSAVLVSARVFDLFDVRVDGLDSARLGLRGKPAPDTFLEAARRLGAEPRRVVVFEDAIAGVRAGRAGDFGLVIGVDRVGHAEALRRAGADVIVTSLAELELTRGRAVVHP